uniref:Large ribosomal subunit protein bL32c n=1 Tax=Incarvillea compacta TaxID=291318 RepID=A0A7G7XQX9_9LAMI|nr:ribosomal protein L32 [Incarvillea compacta]QNH82820.1 ribosomal protein L32 [Incarvillea compacta]
MSVPKKRTSASKKRIRKNVWKRKGYWAALKAFSLGKSLSTGTSKSFFCETKILGKSLSTGTSKGFFYPTKILGKSFSTGTSKGFFYPTNKSKKD